MKSEESNKPPSDQETAKALERNTISLPVKEPLEIVKESVEQIPPKEFIRQEEARRIMVLRDKAASLLFWAYGGLLLSTTTIILLQGFHLWGFNLEWWFLHWLGSAILGEVAALVVIVYKFLFTKLS